MAVRLRKAYWLALLSLVAVAGCCCQIIVPVAGEPRGPSGEFYAPRPAGWRDGCERGGYVAEPCVEERPRGEIIAAAPARESYPVAAAAAEQPRRSNAVRHNSRGTESPLLFRGAEFVATETASARIHASPAPRPQSMPPASPAIEHIPARSAPTFVVADTEPANRSIQRASAELPVARTFTLAPPANAAADQIATSPAAPTEPHLNQPKLLPLIENAQPISLQEKFARWQPPKYIPSAIAATALVTVEKAPANVETAPADAPSPAHLESDSSMSKRVEQHLRHNLQL